MNNKKINGLLIVFFLFTSVFVNYISAQSKSSIYDNTKKYEINGMSIPISSPSIVKEFDAKSLTHDVGFQTNTGWSVLNGKNWTNLQRGDGGFLARGAYMHSSRKGGVRALFRLKIDSNEKGVWDKILRLELYDSITNTVVSQQTIERNYFTASDRYQNFILHASFDERMTQHLEARVWYFGKAGVELEKIVFIVDTPELGIPNIINKSSADEKHCRKLIDRAISGLGFSGLEGPNANDLIFINDYYLVWIDQTGYYGKMNGLWLLNNEKGEKLNFHSFDKSNKRVTNFLTVAEEGKGQWPKSYMGAEHFEIPTFIKEDNDESTPVESGISNWYTLNEANLILGTGGTGRIPWWTCCSGIQNNKQSFYQINPVLDVDIKDGSLSLNYLAPITKGVDADGTYDGDRCQANMLFYNNIRYPVYMKLGYTFYSDKPYFDRTYSIYNPESNFNLPANTFWAIIHGILITKTPNSIEWKKNLFSYINPSKPGIIINGTEAQLNSWSKLDVDTEADLIGGLAAEQSSFTISDNQSYERGHSFYFGFHSELQNNFNSSREGNISFCKCVVHGNWELGGGILNNVSPIKVGDSSEKVIRRIGFPQGEPINDNTSSKK